MAAPYAVTYPREQPNAGLFDINEVPVFFATRAQTHICICCYLL